MDPSDSAPVIDLPLHDPQLGSDGREVSTEDVRDTPRHLESPQESALAPSGRGIAIGMLVIGLLAGFGGGFLVGQRLAPPPPPRAIEVPRPAPAGSTPDRPVSSAPAAPVEASPAETSVLPAPLDAARGAPSDGRGAQDYTEAPVVDAPPTQVSAPEVKEPVAPTTAPRRAGTAGIPAEGPRGEPEAGPPLRTPPPTGGGVRRGDTGAVQRDAGPRPTVTVNTPGTIRFDSRPPGAIVYVDDVRVGVTPMTLNSVSAGTHRVRLELAGDSPWTTSVTVEPGGQLFVGASLE